jgi:HK97 family phage major capsid protein
MPTTKTKTIETKVFFREYNIRADQIDQEKRTVDLSFSSEEPVDRYYGQEILDHSVKSVKLDRLNNAGALLMDHDRTAQVGVVEKATVGSDRKGRALVRFGKAARADEAFADVVDGIRKNVSVGYVIHKMKQEDSDPDFPIYRATLWEPIEISLVSVPADYSVGVGRSQFKDLTVTTEVTYLEKETRTMPDPIIEPTPGNRTTPAPATLPAPAVDTTAIQNSTRQAEQTRCRELIAYGEKFNCRDKAMEAIAAGTSVDDFRAKLLEGMAGVKPVETSGDLGLSDRQSKEYSIVRLLNALANPQDHGAREAAGFEFECSREFAKLTQRRARGAFVPPDVLKRDLLVGTPAAGGYTKATDLMAGNFIELLRNKMIVRAAGATILTGLVGDIAIPKQTGGATAYWVDENGAITESAQAFGQLPLAPKTIGALTQYTRKLLIQSAIDIENFVRKDLASVLGLALDLASLHGTGLNNQPAGLDGLVGVGSVVGGTNGAAPAWADVVALETEVATDNADLGALAYITNAKVRGYLKTTFKNATYGEIPIWEKGTQPGVGEVNGYPAYASNQVASNLTKGSASEVCSAIFFGNWADLIIGLWSGIDLLVDPYTHSDTGAVRVTAFQDADLGARHAESFAVMLDALTA